MADPAGKPAETPGPDSLAAIREWQRERTNDLATGSGGLVHHPAPVTSPQEPAEPGAAPLPGQIDGDRQAAAIQPARLDSEDPKAPAPLEDTPDETGPGQSNAGDLQDSALPDAAEGTHLQHSPQDPEAGTSPTVSASSSESLLPAEKANALEERLDDAQWRVTDSIDHISVARELIEQIGQARALLDRGPVSFEETEIMVSEIEYRIAREVRSAAISARIAFRILAYEIAWLVALTAALIALPGLRILPDAYQTIAAALIGGVGGSGGAVVALWKHYGIRHDFSSRQGLWYFSQPVLAIPLGALVQLVLQAAVVASVGGSASVENPALIYAASAAAGVQLGALGQVRARRRRK